MHPAFILNEIESIEQHDNYSNRDLGELQKYLNSASLAAIKDLHFGGTYNYHKFKEGLRLATVVNRKLEKKNPKFKAVLNKMIAMRQNMQPMVLKIEQEHRETNPKQNHEWKLFHAEREEIQKADGVIHELASSGKFKLIKPDANLMVEISKLSSKTVWDDKSMMEYRQKSLTVIKNHLEKSTKDGDIGEPMLLSGMKLAPGVSPAYVAMRMDDNNKFMIMEILPKDNGTTSVCDNPLGKDCGEVITISNDKLLSFFTESCPKIVKQTYARIQH